MDTLSLPQSLVSLLLHDNRFKGTFDIAGLPRNVRIVNIARNGLCGSLDVRSFPQTIEIFHASDSAFSGTIDLISLPVHLQKFSVEGNHLSGEIDLRFPSRPIFYCHFGENAFQQDVVVFPSDRSNIRYPALDNHTFGSFIHTNGDAVMMTPSSDKQTLKLSCG
ncbi:leucine-rich repeat protein [Perkinsela sp. CCAP 1560/4]|nr:leucine-rich repeat protein [Perkinsela sp. CCAP 1560/4]|eukprot:KNH07901.1 leucine-rich repeat protein [Perkinsela sp. CCAP 1560/4]